MAAAPLRACAQQPDATNALNSVCLCLTSSLSLLSARCRAGCPRTALKGPVCIQLRPAVYMVHSYAPGDLKMACRSQCSQLLFPTTGFMTQRPRPQGCIAGQRHEPNADDMCTSIGGWGGGGHLTVASNRLLMEHARHGCARADVSRMTTCRVKEDCLRGVGCSKVARRGCVAPGPRARFISQCITARGHLQPKSCGHL